MKKPNRCDSIKRRRRRRRREKNKKDMDVRSNAYRV
jgi:hypothetical protein